MKKYLLLLAIFLLPLGVLAEDDPGLSDKLDAALGGKNKIVITDKTLNNNYLLGSPSETEPESDLDGFTRFASAYIKNMTEVKEFLKEYSDYHPIIDVYCKTYNRCGIAIRYDYDARGTCSDEEYAQLVAEGYDYPGCYYSEYEVTIENIETEYDQNVYNTTITQVFGPEDSVGFPSKNYYLYDLAFINQLYNQNYGGRNLIDEKDRVAYYDLLATSFPEVKDITNNHPEFKLVSSGMSWKGTNNADYRVKYEYPADYIVYYNNVAYRVATANFLFAPILFVDESTPDDELIDAAKERIEDYLNNSKIKVVIDDITPTFSESDLQAIYSELNEYLTAIGSTATASSETRVYSLKIGNTTSEKNFYIFKTASKNLKALELQAIEKTTGIRFTSSASIPSDSIFDVTNVTEAYRKLNKRVQEAYDIRLFSYSASSYIKSVAGGMKIYIPVSDGFTIGGRKVAYLDDNGKILEEFDITIETIDGKKYASFITDHLSVYAITEDADIIDVPDTLKNISLVLIIGLIGIAGVGTYFITRNKKKEINQE